jgi:hypothetical protein
MCVTSSPMRCSRFFKCLETLKAGITTEIVLGLMPGVVILIVYQLPMIHEGFHVKSNGSTGSPG